MNRSKKVGYTYYGRKGKTRTGVTNNPARRRGEHNGNTGGNGYLKVRTGQMTPEQARRWERGQSNTRGY